MKYLITPIGGQNVNKRDTSVSLVFNIFESSFSNQQKQQIINKIGRDKIIIKVDSRNQFKSKEEAYKRLYNHIFESLKISKKRIQTKIPKSQKKKRLKDKANNSRKKQFRKPKLNDIENY